MTTASQRRVKSLAESGWAWRVKDAQERQEYIGTVFRHLIQGISKRIPSQCAVCHAWPSQSVCEACVAVFAQPSHRCYTCALPVPTGVQQCGACITTPPPLDACLAAVPYAFPWSNLVADFKFRQHPGWARTFTQLLRAAPWVEPALDAADLLIPMPLSHQRLRERGYNQSLVLASALDASKTAHGVLLRMTDAPPQRTLPRSERLRAVTHAYAVDPLQAPKVFGRRLVLLDDVMTTGATLHAAARALRLAGAIHITALVLARTDQARQ